MSEGGDSSDALAAVLLGLLLTGGSPAAGAPAGPTAAGPDTLPVPGLADETLNPALADLDATLWTQTAAEYRGRGVRVFYVTNRNADQEAPTRRNLERLGFPLSDTMDVLLTERERPEWEEDKVSRREHVARRHRILLLVGDNLGDFTDERQPARWRRARAAGRPGGRPGRPRAAGKRPWGRRWIVIPNPIYGAWEEAVLEDLEGEEPAPADRLRAKVRATVPMTPDSGAADGGR